MTYQEIVRKDFDAPEAAKYDLFQAALAEFMKDRDYYVSENTPTTNYSDCCYRLGWPDWQDGGLCEQAIDRALEVIKWIHC